MYKKIITVWICLILAFSSIAGCGEMNIDDYARVVNGYTDAEVQVPENKEPPVFHGVWEFSHAINVAGDRFSAKDCGGDWTLYLMENGYGFIVSPNGISGLKWKSPNDDAVSIEFKQYTVQFKADASFSNTISFYMNGPEGSSELFFERTGPIEYKKSKVGSWYTSNIIYDDGTQTAMVRSFRDNGVSYPMLWMHNTETNETAICKGKSGYWLSVKDMMLYCDYDSYTAYKWLCSPMNACTFGRIIGSQGQDVYDFMLGLFALEYGNKISVYESSEQLPDAALDMNVPINYDQPHWYEKRAGAFWGEYDADGTHYVSKLILNENGTAEYTLSDSLIEPEHIYENSIYKWMPAERGINIWIDGGKEPQYMQNNNGGYYHQTLDEREIVLSPLPESFLTMIQAAEKNRKVSLRDFLGVWTLSEQPEDEKRYDIQIALNHFGTADMNTIVHMPDPRETYQENETNLAWYPSKNGIILVNEPDDTRTQVFVLKDGKLCTEDGFVYVRTTDYSAWSNGKYQYEMIKDYTQSGHAGVWKSEDLDMWEGEEYIYLYLAADGTGKYLEEDGSWIREEAPLIWKPDANGFSFKVPETESFHLLDGDKWSYVNADASDAWGKWDSPSDGYVSLKQMEEFWIDAEEDAAPEEAIIDYQVNDDGSITLTDYYLNTKNLVIPETIDGYDKIRIGEKLFMGNTIFRSVTLSDSVIEICQGAFQECYNLQDVILGEGVRAIGAEAFRNCSKLTGITIPAGVERIENNTFANCGKLGSLVIPDSVTFIGSNAFENCTALGEILLPDSILEIGDYAFYSCGRQINISLPKNLISLGERAFAYCQGISSLTIPAGLKHIGQGAFEGCGSIDSLEFAEGLEIIGAGMFAGCGNLTDVNIPGSIRVIAESAFARCAKLSQVQLQEGVEVIGESSFAGCEALKNMLLPSTLREIGRLALQGCYALTSLAIPESVGVFGENAFGIKQLMLVLDVKEGSAAQAYAQESGIEFRTGNSSDTQTVSYAADSDFSWELRQDGTAVILQYKGKEQSVSIPKELGGCSVTEIGDKAFVENADISEVILPEGIVCIGAKAFYKCTSLQKVILPASLAEIRNFAFNNCPNLVLLVPENSFAESYAASKKLKWEHYTPGIPATADAVVPQVDDSEETLRQALNGLRCVRTYYEDYDGDGIHEMFVETLSSGPDEFGFESDYELWFVSPFTTRIIKKHVSEYDTVSLIGDSVPYMIRYKEMYGGSDLYGVKNGEAVRVE